MTDEQPLDKFSADLEQSLASADIATLTDDEIDEMFDVVGSVGATHGEGLIPEIPILNTIWAISKTMGSISNRLLAQKVIRFLRQLSTIPPKEREAFLARLEGNQWKRIREQLFLVLDKHESYRKSEIQAKLLGAWIREQLTEREFWDLTHTTSSVNIDALDDLQRFYRDELTWDLARAEDGYSFAFLRVVGIDNSKIGTFGGGSPTFTKIPLSQKFVDIITA